MSAPAERPRVLIVEDQAVTAADLQASLEGLGYQVAGIVNTGPEAVRAAQQFTPEVIVMDIRLKGPMDGIAAAAEIRKQQNIPVVFVTANSNEELLLRASVAGAYGYLLKPFRTKELNAAILVALQHHRLARELFSEQTWLRTMLKSLSDSVIATDAEGRVRYINTAGEDLTGVSLEYALGKPIEEVCCLMTMSNHPVEMSHLRKALLTKVPIDKSRFLMRSRDGRVIPVENAASPIQAAGDVLGAVTIIVDISDRLRREHELAQEHDRLVEEVQVTNQALGDTRAELRALAGHLMTVQEDERRRVARELHDDLSQRAALAEIDLQSIAALIPPHEERAHRILQAVQEKIGDLSMHLREISHRLHPSMVEDLGLAAALRALVNDYREKGGEATLIARANDGDLPLEIATALYRIAQEALRNASKHAQGEPVRVVLDKNGREIELRVEDAGPGFDLNQVRARGGLGLVSMQERARLVGGSLLLRTRPEEGTQILVRIPLDSPPAPTEPAPGQ